MKESRSISSNIIPFSKGGASASEARVRAAEITRERRYAAIDAALEKNPRMTRDQDRTTVARNLGDILAEFQKCTGIKKRDVLRAASIGGPDDSTKQLFNYTLTPQNETEKRKSKLIKHTRKYRDIAEKAAEMARWNKRGILIAFPGFVIRRLASISIIARIAGVSFLNVRHSGSNKDLGGSQLGHRMVLRNSAETSDGRRMGEFYCRSAYPV